MGAEPAADARRSERTDAAFSRPEPVFERRAYMLDISRDRVPTRDTLKWLVDVLSALRYNELQLYVEHTFAYERHEAVWRDASPLTRADMVWLDGMCGAHGIDLVANMNGFGHMARWLVLDEYRELAECPEMKVPTCLAPTAGNAEFAVELAREIASTVTHRRIHIGGDEPFELGDGVSAAEVAREGRDHVYLEHLRRIIEPLVAEDREVMFWADLFRRDSSLMNLIPDGAVGVVWNYEQPGGTDWADFLSARMLARLGLPDHAVMGFAAHARLFIESDRSFWVAPGTSTWNSIIGRNVNAAGNIADAVEVGGVNGSPGFLLADWGDNGHWQPLAVSLPSIVRAGVASWQGEMPEASVVTDLIDDVTGLAPSTGGLIDELGRLGEGLGMPTFNASPIFEALTDTAVAPLKASGPLAPDPDGYQRAVSTLARARDVFGEPDAARVDSGDRREIMAAEMAAACGLADLGLRRIGTRFDLGALDPSAAEIDEALAAQRQAWLFTSRPGGLDDSIAKFRR